MPEAPVISLVAIKLQMLVLLVLAVLQAFLPAYPDRKWKSKVWNWYIEHGNMGSQLFYNGTGTCYRLGFTGLFTTAWRLSSQTEP
jgi:hypothetical protein